MMAYYVLGQGTAPPCPQQKDLFLPRGGGWRRRVAFFHSFRRAPEGQTHPRSKPMFHLFQKRMHGTRWMKPALRAAPPPRPPRAPGAGGGLALFPPSLGPGQQIGSRLQSQGQDPSDSPPALPWRVLPEKILYAYVVITKKKKKKKVLWGNRTCKQQSPGILASCSCLLSGSFITDLSKINSSYSQNGVWATSFPPFLGYWLLVYLPICLSCTSMILSAVPYSKPFDPSCWFFVLQEAPSLAPASWQESSC